jgi:hypothetical protein
VFQDGSVEAILAKSSSDPSDHSETFDSGIHPPPYSFRMISFCPVIENGRAFSHVRVSSVRYSSPTRLDTRRVFHRHNFSSTASFSTISSLLTLFSKFFSSFLRSTCMLSVSYKYLALEEVYLLIRAAFPNYPTLRKPPYKPIHPKTGLSPSMVVFSKTLMTY